MADTQEGEHDVGIGQASAQTEEFVCQSDP